MNAARTTLVKRRRTLSPEALLVALLAGHWVAWTLVFYLTQPCAPIDLVEMLYWGREWELGYYKHPPLPSWIAQATAQTFGVGLAIYVVGQATAVVCLWAAWRLARDLVGPWHALLAAAALEACYYYTYAMSETINNTIFVRMWWALGVLLFWRAVNSGRNIYWAAAGACLGLGMLSKYSIAVLALALLLAPVFVPATRRHFRTPGPYLLASVALALFAPHLVWLWQHDFITLHWVEERSSGELTGLASHLVHPLEFIVKQAGAYVPLLIVVAPVVAAWRLRKFDGAEDRTRARLLAMLVFGPIAIQMLISLATGMHLRSMWGGPLFTFVPAVLLFLLPTKFSIDRPAMRTALARCAIAGCVMLVAAAIRNVQVPYWTAKGSRIHFPGRQVADLVEDRWRERSDRPLPAIGGQWWLAAAVACYADDRPTVYGDLNPRHSPWTSDDEVRRDGAVFIWRDDENAPQFRQELLARFPTAEVLPEAAVAWQTTAEVPPVRIGCAVLPPQSELWLAKEPAALRRLAHATLASDSTAKVK